jgi:hypothetical protein
MPTVGAKMAAVLMTLTTLFQRMARTSTTSLRTIEDMGGWAKQAMTQIQAGRWAGSEGRWPQIFSISGYLGQAGIFACGTVALYHASR